MERPPDLNKRVREFRFKNIIDMGIDFSAMIRVFEKGSKKKLHGRILSEVRNVFGAKSEGDFRDIHSNFCDWGQKEIGLAKKAEPARYGQIAKTFDVTLKVVIYYSELPDSRKSTEISEWLNAAVDTKMMNMLEHVLNRKYSATIQPWPKTVGQVDEKAYLTLQKIVRKFIAEVHNNGIKPVQFDDIYWRLLNREREQLESLKTYLNWR